MTNDPWIGAGHLNDFVLVKPCFLDGRVVGLNACTSHLADIGGRSFGPDAADVHEEGMFIPPIKLIEGGTINHTLMTLLRANSRVPVQNEGDLYALIACCEVGEERLADMMREFTLTSLAGLSDHIINTSREATRERLRSWPSGTWSNEMMVDGYEFEIRIAARLTIARRRPHHRFQWQFTGLTLRDQLPLDLFPGLHGVRSQVRHCTRYSQQCRSPRALCGPGP